MTDKIKISLIPATFIKGIGAVLTHGADKHTDRGWEDGMDYDYVFSALQRHLWAWWGGEKLDPESGHSHLYHAACRLMFLATYEERDMGKTYDKRKTPQQMDFLSMLLARDMAINEDTK